MSDDVTVLTLPDKATWLKAAEPRFWAKVEPEPNSGCLLWIGATNPGGYGVMGRGRRGEGTILVHRFAYLLARGEIPDGLEPDHLCRVRCCANAWHLELVTRQINMLRGDHPSAVAVRLGLCKRGHPFTPENIKIVNGNRRCRACCNMLRRVAYAHAG